MHMVAVLTLKNYAQSRFKHSIITSSNFILINPSSTFKTNSNKFSLFKFMAMLAIFVINMT